MSSSIVDFLHYEIPKVQFEKTPSVGDDVSANLHFAVQMNENDATLRRVTMIVELSGNLTSEITIAGVFRLNDNYPKEYENSNALLVIAGSILIPYVRSLLSFLSSADGSPPFIFPTINLNEFFSQEQEG